MTLARPRCIVTGAHGYLGGHLVRYLEERGWQVVKAIRPSRNSPSVNSDDQMIYELGQSLSSHLFRSNDVLVHCAYDFTCNGYDASFERNCVGTQKLFEAAVKAGVRTLIYVSSMSAYEGCVSVYGQVKLASEKVALDHGAMVIRPGLIYGGKNLGIFGKLQRVVTMSRVIPAIVAPGRLALTHIDDLSDVILDLIEGKVEVTMPFCCAHPRGYQFHEILGEIARDAKRQVVFLPIAWQLVAIGLWFVEKFTKRLPFSSDNLRGLVYADPAPKYLAILKSRFRTFGA